MATYDLTIVETQITLSAQEFKDIELEAAAGTQILAIDPTMKPDVGFSISVQDIDKSDPRKWVLKRVQHLGGHDRPDGTLRFRIFCYK